MNRFVILVLPILAGCDAPPMDAPKYRYDAEVRKEMFFKCLQSVPSGPSQTKYNDWDEVVSECGTQSYFLARKCFENCNGETK